MQVLIGDVDDYDGMDLCLELKPKGPTFSRTGYFGEFQIAPLYTLKEMILAYTTAKSADAE